VTLAESLNRSGELERAGGLAYLAEVATNTPSVANIRAYARAVRERANLSALIRAAHEIADSGFNPEGRNSEELLDEAERRIMQISESRPSGGGPEPVNPLLKRTIDRID